MGLVGNYLTVDAEMIEQIIDGELELLDLEAEADEGYYIDIDKSWAGLQHIFQNIAEANSNNMDWAVPMVNEKYMEIEGEDFEAFGLTAEDVKEVSTLLQNLSEDDFKKHYNLNSMIDDEVYPFSQADLEDEDGVYDYLNFYFAELKDYFLTAANKNKGIVFYIM